MEEDPRRIVYNCHHCSEHGAVVLDKVNRQDHVSAPYQPPEPPPKIDTGIIPEHVQWLASRGISEESAAAMGVKSATKFFRQVQAQHSCLMFPYFDEQGKDSGQKYRSVPEKMFTQEQGGGWHLFGMTIGIDYSAPLTICVGELDAITLRQCGIPNAVSAPGGDQSLGWIEHCQSFLSRFSRYILAGDTDKPGLESRGKIAAALGAEKCWIAAPWPEGCKDANDTLVKHSRYAVIKALADSEPIPVPGLCEAAEYFDEAKKLYRTGAGKGESTGLAKVDEIYTVVPGQMTIVTGHPGHGKSNWVDQIMVNLAESKGWRFGVCSFENEPPIHVGKLSEIYIGAPFLKRNDQQIPESQLDPALAWVQDHFCFLDLIGSDQPPTLDNILEKASVAVSRYGIQGLVIDPYNYIEKTDDTPEYEWISKALSRTRSWGIQHKCHVWFLAHPQKMYSMGSGRLPVPKGYDISGSAAWFAKADAGVTVYRDDEKRQVEVHVWKMRHKWVGKVGQCCLGYDSMSGRYYDMEPIEEVETGWSKLAEEKGW